MARIDVHVLYTERDNMKWIEQCKQSLSTAEITQHWLPAHPTTIGEGRHFGFSQGTHEFVSFCDPDDIYEPSAFGELVDIMTSDASVSMAFTNEIMIDASGKRMSASYRRPSKYSFDKHRQSARYVHGICLFRRELIERCHEEVRHFPFFHTWALSALMLRYGRITYTPIIGRLWRQHDKQTTKTLHSDDVERYRAEIVTIFKDYKNGN